MLVVFYCVAQCADELVDAQKETSAVTNDEELDQLMALLHEPLPVSFRLNLHRLESRRCVIALSLRDARAACLVLMLSPNDAMTECKSC